MHSRSVFFFVFWNPIRSAHHTPPNYQQKHSPTQMRSTHPTSIVFCSKLISNCHFVKIILKVRNVSTRPLFSCGFSLLQITSYACGVSFNARPWTPPKKRYIYIHQSNDRWQAKQHETAQARAPKEKRFELKKPSDDDEVIHQFSRGRRDMDDGHGVLGAPYYS